MLPAILVLLGGAVAVSVWRNQREVKSLADSVIHGAFRGKREIEAMATRLLDQGWQPDEADEAAVWVNVKIPRQRYTIHRESGCIYQRNMAETDLSGVGRLKAIGGWLPFPTVEAAQRAYPEAQLCKAISCWDAVK